MKFLLTAALGAEDIACILSLVGISPETDDALARGREGIVGPIMVRTLIDVVRSDLQVKGVA